MEPSASNTTHIFFIPLLNKTSVCSIGSLTKKALNDLPASEAKEQCVRI
jgi:hypothetical protein